MTKEEFDNWERDFTSRLYEWASTHAKYISVEELVSAMMSLVQSVSYGEDYCQYEYYKNREEYTLKRFKDLYETIINE